MTSDQPTLPLSCDLETLERLLFECPDVDGAMLLSELDGYLAALLVSPHPIAQDIWLPEIWGGGEFPGEPQRCGLLTRLVLTRKAEVASELLQGDLAYLPIFDIDYNSNEVLWELWIDGFARAMALSGKIGTFCSKPATRIWRRRRWASSCTSRRRAASMPAMRRSTRMSRPR